MGKPTRWVTETNPGHSQWYIDRFRRLAAEGADLAGEARLLDTLVPPGARILDAGTGTGRVAAALAARGHSVLGVDADPALIEAARADHPGPRFLVADLAELDLAAQGEPAPFDAAVVAGNVMVFVAPGTERAVLARVAAHVRRDGLVVVGFGTDRGYPLTDFDADAVAAGLRLEHRFATWDLRPWREDADFAVTVFRRPAGEPTDPDVPG
ncbi:class I SAM-dependent methyltransferase [Micromonospora soli]|uniref:class I SAM-dependent methyltransferase n=1 Tax=Micromonospora sp. NBRC 110009 TaxID=3061627 RepID=UPI002672CFB4|nr:class I SAM-dependent methyltransferase [Micromonospora sp. NBRC 110009]WKT98401.1 class I SAM-dependent methyltransferase [Micromonospora sp. NBRC 110009]